MDLPTTWPSFTSFGLSWATVSGQMLNKNHALLLGAATGLVGLIAMVRLVSGAFTGGLSMFA